MYLTYHLRRGIGVRVKGVVGSDAIVAQQLSNSYAIVQACSTIAPRTLKNKGNCLTTSSLWELLRCLLWTISSPFVNYCVSSRDPFYSDPNTPPINAFGKTSLVPCANSFCHSPMLSKRLECSENNRWIPQLQIGLQKLHIADTKSGST